MLFPWYLIRENTISYSDFAPLRSTELVDFVTESHLHLESFQRMKDEVVAALEVDFHETKDPSLLNVKRKVFNRKGLKEEEAVTDALEEYRLVRDFIEEDRAAGEALFQLTEASHRKHLWTLFKEKPVVTNPLPLVNHQMHHKLDKFLSTPPDTHKSKVKKIDSTLLRIASRSTFKTSPFSSFTSIDLKSFTPQPEAPAPHYQIELNYYIWQKILQLIANDPAFIPYLSYLYSGRHEDGIVDFTSRIDLNRGKIFNNIENHFIAKDNPIFSALSNFNRPIAYEEVLSLLKPFTSEEKAERFFVDGLLKKGILYADFELDEYAKDVRGDFYKKLGSLPEHHKINLVVETMEAIDGLVDEYRRSGWKERFGIYSKIMGRLARIEEAFGYTFTKENLFYEDYLAPASTDLELDESFIRELGIVQKLAILTSIPLQFKYEFAYRFHERYKGKAMAVRKKEVRDLYMEEVMKFTNWTDILAGVPDLKSTGGQVMEEIKGEIRDLFQKAKHGDGQLIGDEILALYDSFMERTGFSKEHLSSTALFQKTEDGYILNKLYAGHMKLFTRYFQYSPSIYEDSRFKEYVAQMCPDVLEIREGFGFNANRHETFLNQRLLIPGSKTKPADETAHWSNDLHYLYNEESGLIEIVGEDGPLEIDYIGSLVDYMMPPSIRMLSTGLTPRFDPGLVKLWEIHEETRPVIDHIPRLHLGHLVIMREKWLLDTSHFLQEEEVYDHYRKTVTRFKELGLPLEFFVSRIVDAETYDFDKSNRSDMKPQYMNLFSPLFFKEWVKLLKEESRLVVEELYPAGGGENHNIEYQVEVSMDEKPD